MSVQAVPPTSTAIYHIANRKPKRVYEVTKQLSKIADHFAPSEMTGKLKDFAAKGLIVFSIPDTIRDFLGFQEQAQHTYTYLMADDVNENERLGSIWASFVSFCDFGESATRMIKCGHLFDLYTLTNLSALEAWNSGFDLVGAGNGLLSSAQRIFNAHYPQTTQAEARKTEVEASIEACRYVKDWELATLNAVVVVIEILSLSAFFFSLSVASSVYLGLSTLIVLFLVLLYLSDLQIEEYQRVAHISL